MLLEVGGAVEAGAGRGSSRSWPDWRYWLVGAPLGAPRPGWADPVADSPASRGCQCLGGLLGQLRVPGLGPPSHMLMTLACPSHLPRGLSARGTILGGERPQNEQGWVTCPIHRELRALCVLPASFPCPVVCSPQNSVAHAWLCWLGCARHCQTARACPASRAAGLVPCAEGAGRWPGARTPSTRHAQMWPHRALVTPGWGEQLAGSGGAGDARPAAPCGAGAAARVLPRFLPSSSVAEGAGTSRVSEAVPAHAEPHPAAGACRGSRHLSHTHPQLCVLAAA